MADRKLIKVGIVAMAAIALVIGISVGITQNKKNIATTSNASDSTYNIDLEASRYDACDDYYGKSSKSGSSKGSKSKSSKGSSSSSSTSISSSKSGKSSSSNGRGLSEVIDDYERVKMSKLRSHLVRGKRVVKLSLSSLQLSQI